MSTQTFKVYNGQDWDQTDPVATLTFTDGKLTDVPYVVPAWWTKPRNEYPQPFQVELKRQVSPEMFQQMHTGLVMVPDGGSDE